MQRLLLFVSLHHLAYSFLYIGVIGELIKRVVFLTHISCLKVQMRAGRMPGCTCIAYYLPLLYGIARRYSQR